MNASSGKEVVRFKWRKFFEILSLYCCSESQSLASIKHQVDLADKLCCRLSLVLVTFGVPQNTLFPKQNGHKMKKKKIKCIACFNDEALHNQRGPYLSLSTLPRLPRLNFLLHIDVHLQWLRQNRLQSHLPDMSWALKTAQPCKGSPAHQFEPSTHARPGLLLKSQLILWLITMGKPQAFWETLFFSQIFILL